MKAQYISTPSRARRITAAVWVAAVGLSFVPAYFVNGVNIPLKLECSQVEKSLLVEEDLQIFDIQMMASQ